MSAANGGHESNQNGHKGVGKEGRKAKPVRPEADPVLGEDALVVQYGQTPFDEDARFDLTPRYQDLATMDELNAAEADNIAAALMWLGTLPFNAPEDLLNQPALRDLHRRMFGEVWTWAGKLRRRATNLGVAPVMIAQDWEAALRNTVTQIEHSSYPVEEIGVRFHHAMLAIHCFTNGNGRHARVTANEIGRLLGVGDRPYTWGARSGDDPVEVRRRYLGALRLADRTDEFGPLVAVAQS